MPHSNYIFHFVSSFAGFHSEIISRLLTQAEFQFRQRFGTWLFLTDVDGRIEAFKSRCEKPMKIESRLRTFWFFCLLYKNFESIVWNFPLCAFVAQRKKIAQKSIFSRKILFSEIETCQMSKWHSPLLCWWNQLLVKWAVSMKQLRLTETYQKTFPEKSSGFSSAVSI